MSLHEEVVFRIQRLNPKIVKEWLREKGETVVETPVNGTTTTEAIPEKKEILEVQGSQEEEKKDAEKKSDSCGRGERRSKEEKRDLPQPRFNRSHNVPSISPYCFKLESWIKLNNIKYENVDHKSKLRSRKGLLPFIELNGEEIADSDIIIKALSKKFEKDLDEGLSQEQRNVQHAMLTMVDNHFTLKEAAARCYIELVSQWKTRHMDHLVKGYKLNLQSLSGYKFPNPLIAFYLKHTYIRKAIRKVKATGLGEYSNEELDHMGKDDLKVLSDFLGDQQFFFGDEPHSLDLNAFVQLTMLLCVEKDVYLTRMKDRAWGDHWDQAIGDSCDLNPHIPKPSPPAPEEPAAPKSDDDAKEKDENKEKSEKDEKEKDDENKEKSVENK
ncbi:Failed axon connections [Lepeophtheirus salmonis]|uniref:Failed axon connections n=1 Tax=Lepeophtheirus salmonis TaxID=72036 RepID=A0A7R8H268_LEPSM|nr:Failed axon connections [Lepeophtheirus salmonis]CAF2808300.1 Failed axon connections [Lepeophtheirus salmonis]